MTFHDPGPNGVDQSKRFTQPPLRSHRFARDQFIADQMMKQAEARKARLRLLWFAGLILVAAFAIIALTGCKATGSGLFGSGLFGSGSTPPCPDGPPDGSTETFKNLRWMATFAFVPGLLLTVGSIWIGALRSIGVALLGIGIALAVVPWFLHEYAPYIIGVGLVLAVGWVAWWAWDQIDYKRRRKQLVKKREEATESQQVVKAQAQIDELDRLYGRRVVA